MCTPRGAAGYSCPAAPPGSKKRVVDMGARIGDRKRKKIILDRVEGMSYRAIASKYKVSEYAVRKIVKEDPDFAEKIAQEKARNARAMVDYLEDRRWQAQEIIGKMLSAMTDEEKLKDSSVRELATAFGILVDKFTENARTEAPNSGLLESINDVLSRRRAEHD